MKILFVEDDQAIALGLVYSLEKEGYEVIHCVSQKAALGLLETQVFDLLLLDVSLPDGDGYTICKPVSYTHLPKTMVMALRLIRWKHRDMRLPKMHQNLINLILW